METSIEHVPVLTGPVMELLAPQPGEVVVDCTVGHGGHALLLARAIGPGGRLIGLDVDPANLERARRRLSDPALVGSLAPFELVRANFSELESTLETLGLRSSDDAGGRETGAAGGCVDVIFADLGVSTDQLLDPGRGLTFSADAPLDMRLDDRLERTAADLVNALSENELSDLIFFNSQERFSRRIAKRIRQVRREGRIRRTSELVRIVCSALGTSPESHPGRLHPATRTFLALRMAVNRELENLTRLLEAAPRLLRAGGRIGVISFHSGEDRLVKQNFLEQKRAGVYEIRTRKPVGPTSDEIRQNPRARSAKLRVAVRLPEA